VRTHTDNDGIGKVIARTIRHKVLMSDLELDYETYELIFSQGMKIRNKFTDDMGTNLMILKEACESELEIQNEILTRMVRTARTVPPNRLESAFFRIADSRKKWLDRRRNLGDLYRLFTELEMEIVKIVNAARNTT
jgi:hypothetical protein